MRRCPSYGPPAKHRDGDAALLLLRRHFFFQLPLSLSLSLASLCLFPSPSSARERRARGSRARERTRARRRAVERASFPLQEVDKENREEQKKELEFFLCVRKPLSFHSFEFENRRRRLSLLDDLSSSLFFHFRGTLLLLSPSFHFLDTRPTLASRLH